MILPVQHRISRCGVAGKNDRVNKKEPGDRMMDPLKAKDGINAAGQTAGRVLRPMLSYRLSNGPAYGWEFANRFLKKIGAAILWHRGEISWKTES
jgi:hypothetical protein